MESRKIDVLFAGGVLGEGNKETIVVEQNETEGFLEKAKNKMCESKNMDKHLHMITKVALFDFEDEEFGKWNNLALSDQLDDFRLAVDAVEREISVLKGKKTKNPRIKVVLDENFVEFASDLTKLLGNRGDIKKKMGEDKGGLAKKEGIIIPKELLSRIDSKHNESTTILDKPGTKITFVGLVKCGKSSLVNYLLNGGPFVYQPVSSATDHSAENKKQKDLYEICEVQEGVATKCVSYHRYKDTKISPAIRRDNRKKIMDLNADYFALQSLYKRTTDETMKETLKNMLQAFDYERVDLESFDNPEFKNCVFIDTPGFDGVIFSEPIKSPIQKAIAESTVVVFMIKAEDFQRKDLFELELEYLSKVTQINRNVIVAISMFDKVVDFTFNNNFSVEDSVSESVKKIIEYQEKLKGYSVFACPVQVKVPRSRKMFFDIQMLKHMMRNFQSPKEGSFLWLLEKVRAELQSTPRLTLQRFKFLLNKIVDERSAAIEENEKNSKRMKEEIEKLSSENPKLKEEIEMARNDILMRAKEKVELEKEKKEIDDEENRKIKENEKKISENKTNKVVSTVIQVGGASLGATASVGLGVLGVIGLFCGPVGWGVSALCLPAAVVSTTLTTANTVAFGVSKNIFVKEINENSEQVQESEKQMEEAEKKVETIENQMEELKKKIEENEQCIAKNEEIIKKNKIAIEAMEKTIKEIQKCLEEYKEKIGAAETIVKSLPCLEYFDEGNSKVPVVKLDKKIACGLSHDCIEYAKCDTYENCASINEGECIVQLEDKVYQVFGKFELTRGENQQIQFKDYFIGDIFQVEWAMSVENTIELK